MILRRFDGFVPPALIFPGFDPFIGRWLDTGLNGPLASHLKFLVCKLDTLVEV